MDDKWKIDRDIYEERCDGVGVATVLFLSAVFWGIVAAVVLAVKAGLLWV